MVNKFLVDHHLDGNEIKIQDIDTKIEKLKEQIQKIKETNPYQYRFLLQDQEAVQNKKRELQKELEEYRVYEQELDQLLEQMMKNGFSMADELEINKGGVVSLIDNHELGEILKPLVREIYLFNSYVAGTTHLEDQSVLGEIKEEDDLLLQREDNRFDQNAILVLTNERRKLGYIPKKDNVVFARLMDAGKMLKAKITTIEHRGNFTEIGIGIYLVDF